MSEYSSVEDPLNAQALINQGTQDLLIIVQNQARTIRDLRHQVDRLNEVNYQLSESAGIHKQRRELEKNWRSE